MTEFTRVGAKTNGLFNTAIYGTDDGQLHKTPDFCATLDLKFTIPGTPPIGCIQPDLVTDGYWWVGTQDGRIYKSTDDGENWVEHVDFEDGFPINAINTPPGGDLWVFGGDTGTPTSLVRVDYGKTGTFESIALAGDLGDAIDLAGAGESIRRAVDHDVGGLLGIGFTGTVDPPFWSNADPLGTPDAWVPAVGLGVAEVVGLAGGVGPGEFLLFGLTTDAYYTTDGENFTAVGTSDAQINDVVWEGTIGVYVAAAEDGILKSIDFGFTWGYMRPSVLFDTSWPVGGLGRAIAFETSVPVVDTPPPPISTIYASVNETDGEGDPLFGDLLNLAGLDTIDEEWVLIARLSSLHGTTSGQLGPMRYWGSGHFTQRVFGGPNRWSDDFGETWAAATLPAGVSSVTALAQNATGDRVWGIGFRDATGTWSRVVYSDDFGATWTLLSTFVSDDNRTLSSLACHPTDDDKIMVAQWATTVPSTVFAMYVRYSLDGGATWTKVQAVNANPGSFISPLCAWLGDRMIVTIYGGYSGAQSMGSHDFLIAYADPPYAALDWEHVALPDNDNQIPTWQRMATFDGKVYLVDLTDGGGSGMTSSRLYRSDDGETWETIEMPAEVNRLYGIDYDAAADVLYIITRDTQAPYAHDHVWSLPDEHATAAGAIVEGDWVDHTANLTDDFKADTGEGAASIMVVGDAP